MNPANWMAIIAATAIISWFLGLCWALRHPSACERMHYDPTNAHIAGTLPDGGLYEFGKDFHLGDRFPRYRIHKTGRDTWTVSTDTFTDRHYTTFENAVAATVGRTQPRQIAYSIHVGRNR